MLEGPYDLRRADELVASTRLNVIEKEHRSFASSIDTRELFALDETPKPHRKKFSNDALVSRVPLGSCTSECGITTPRKLPDAAAQKETKRLYADEELIWRNKASAPTYFQKRVYDDPTLQSFLASLTVEQKGRNKELTRSLLHSIADKHRSDVSKMKEEMDKQGIFHPAANAHRANCIYLLKMHKSITPSNIEDPVLRQLQAELIAKNEAHAAEEEKRRLLFRIVAVGREEAAREIAERKAALLANYSQKEARKSLVASSLNRKASMISLGVQSSLASGGARKQYCPTLTLDQILINSSSNATDGHAPHDIRYGSGRDLELSRRRMSALRKNRKFEIIKRDEVERSNDTAPCKSVKKQIGNPPCSGASAKQSIDGVGITKSCALQDNDRDQQQSEVRRRSMETIAHSKSNSGASHSVSEKAKDSHAEEGKKETESDKSESTITHNAGDSYVYPALVDLIIEPQPQSTSTKTGTGTGTDIGTLSVTGIHENPGIEVSEDLHFEDDNRLKLALRRGSTGRRLQKTSASHLLLPRAQRISIPLGLSAVLLKPIKISHATASQSSTVTLKDSACARVHLAGTWTASGQRTVARYMTCTKNVIEKKKIVSGFANYFLEEEAALIHKEVEDDNLNSLNLAAASRLTTQDLYDPSLDDRRIDPTAVESEVLIAEAAGDLESVTNTVPALTYASGKPLHGKLEETDGLMLQGRGSRVLKAQHSDAEVQSCAMQRKLTQMWDCLQVSTSSRLDFMRKYTLQPYSSKLGLSIDLWSEVAVLVMARQEITRMLVAIKGGSRSMPLQAYDLIESICSAVPTELASRSSMYVPLDLLSMSIKVKDKSKDTDSESGVIRKSRIEQQVSLSASMVTNIIGQIAQRFRVVSASESIMHYKMHGHNESKYVGRTKMSVHAKARNVSQGLFAHDLASSLKLSEPGSVSGSGSVSPIRRENSDWKMKRSASQAISEEGCKDDVGLMIRSATEASACLLQLLKITDQLLYSSSRRTMDEVRDTVTFGKFTVQEWMTATPPGHLLTAVTNSVP